jgi:iron complex outermembrane recepter protein
MFQMSSWRARTRCPASPPRGRIIGGLRYTVSELTIATGATAAVETASQKGKKISYRAGLQYDLGSDTMIFATVNRGFKSGQATIPTDPTLPARIVRPEVPQAYEIGAKTTLFDGLVMDIGAFYTKVKDFQAQACESNANTGLFNCQQINVDSVDSRGAEINFFGRVSDQLLLNTGFICAKTTYESDVPVLGKSLLGDVVDMRGRQVTNAPRYKFTLSGEYSQPLSGSLEAFFAADTVWKSRIRYQQSLQDGETFRPHWTVGGRLGVRNEESRFSASIFVRNLFNVHTPVTLQQPTAQAYRETVAAIFGPNSFRQVGISLDKAF